MKYIRQGDLLFIPIAQLPNLILAPRPNGVLAEGEATGHKHRVETLADAEVLECGFGLYVKVGPNGARIVHEEHGPVTLEPTTAYEVHFAREYDYLNEIAERVRD